MPSYQVRDLMINVVDERLKVQHHGAALCLQEQPTILTCGRLSPVMHVVKKSYLVERAVDIAKAATELEPSAAADVMEHIGAEFGHQVIANAAGATFMPDPNCGGTSYETIPPTITPVVHKAEVLDAADLVAIKAQVVDLLEGIEEIQKQFAPRTRTEVKVVKEHLANALEAL